ncbi:MAG: hypothetical protein A2010_05310 [Nitrospirae bacterium GWD2_57_9]|nr:MAG: hypothetical protein A2010_05310 [Nitrospirae bacterium GWD2_57_9]OGW51193.1 MAG: hypothetical protein A2078_13480 [Nitrospirae bacterium GWC2_57_9]
MLKSLSIKFLILLAAVVLISLSAALFLRELMVRDFREYREGELEDRVYWITADLEGTYEKNKGWRKDVIAEDAVWALMLGFEIRVRNSDGEVVMDTRKALDSLSPLMKRRVMGITEPNTDEAGTPFHSYPLFLAGKEIGSLDAKHLKPRNEHLFIERSNLFLLYSLVVLGGLAIALSVFFSRKLTNPIKRLTGVAESISEGNLAERVAILGKDEIARLSAAFNSMAQALQQQESLRRKLISNVAHELRTPVTAMQGELEGMADGLIAMDRGQIASLQEEVGRLKNMIEGIEELSRAEASGLSLKKKPVDLGPFLENITARFGTLFRDKGVALNLEANDRPLMQADPERLSQIVINLLSNALTATGPGGAVLIRAYTAGTGAAIDVSDNGKGIRQQDLLFVFERFYKGGEGGLGLGLAIVKELVEAHGGTIEVKSEWRKGATFTVSIPSSGLHNSS